MNRFLLFFIGCLAVVVAGAQQQADIRVSYNAHSFYKNGKDRNVTFHLLANATCSKYYHLPSEQIDSLTATPEGLARFEAMQKASMQAMMAQGVIDVSRLPRKSETLYVLKSAADSLLTVYDMLGTDEPVCYTEPFAEMTWIMGEGVKNILGYDCLEATTEYHGRTWTAWFAPDIPLSDGPWKFRGLPGLILEATTESGLSFMAEGIEQTDLPIGGIYGVEKYGKSERKAILRARRAVVDNPKGALEAKGMLKGAQIDFSQLPKTDKKYDFIETDYR